MSVLHGGLLATHARRVTHQEFARPSGPTDAMPEENPLSTDSDSNAPIDAVPVFDDKAEIRETIDLSDAEWIRADAPEGGDEPEASDDSETDDPDDDEPADDESGLIEIAFVDSYIAMRDSSKPDGPFLIFTQAEWDAFVAGVKDGEFDLEALTDSE